MFCFFSSGSFGIYMVLVKHIKWTTHSRCMFTYVYTKWVQASMVWWVANILCQSRDLSAFNVFWWAKHFKFLLCVFTYSDLAMQSWLVAYRYMTVLYIVLLLYSTITLFVTRNTLGLLWLIVHLFLLSYHTISIADIIVGSYVHWWRTGNNQWITFRGVFLQNST